ncbi:MAG: thioredoxin family protein [Flavobacteriales bacterium]|nr:thioredoxin family protein [Flavobacteriales bacterium]
MMINREIFESGYTYTEYRQMINDKLAQGLTTGPEQTQERLDFTKLNVQRMHRLDKTIEIADDVREKLLDLRCKIHWLLLTEAWCGDASQNVPVLAKMAESSPNIELRLLLRDEHLDIMDQFLTAGGRAIPKLIILDGDFNVMAAWGPRPDEIQQQVLENKRTGGMPYSEFAVVVQKWYTQNKGVGLQNEMLRSMQWAGCLEMADSL